MARRPESGSIPIEFAIAAAIERELRAIAGARPPRSIHPLAVAAQDRRLVARLAQRVRNAREAERRRAHRLALQAAMEAARPAAEEPAPPVFWWERD